jgi:hypothetical protein
MISLGDFMQQHNIHKAKTKTDKPAVKRNFNFKAGNSNGCGCGTLILFIGGLSIFFIFKWIIAPILIVSCLASGGGGMR